MRGACHARRRARDPADDRRGQPFPQRDLIVFLAFCVVLATLVLQGLSLPLVIRVLGLEDDGLDVKEEAKARIHAAEAAMARLEELLEDEDCVREDTAERLRGLYEFRRNRFRRASTTATTARSRSGRSSTSACGASCSRRSASAIVALRRRGRIAEEVMHRLQRDLDLEDSRLDV